MSKVFPDIVIAANFVDAMNIFAIVLSVIGIVFVLVHATFVVVIIVIVALFMLFNSYC